MAGRVSVIIPCYEQAHFLAEAVESALAQSYQPLDVTVVDDGCRDSTGEVAATYPDVRCMRQPNQGVSAARNTGLWATHGEYVLFLDADDRLLPGAAEVGVTALEAHPTAAFVAGRSWRIAVDGAPLSTPIRPRVTHDHYVAFLRRCWLGVPEVMHRRTALLAEGGFDRRLRCAEDYDLYLRLTRRFSMVDHYVQVAEYRQHATSLSRDPELMLAATLAALAPHRPGRGAPAAVRAAWRARDNVVWYLDRIVVPGPYSGSRARRSRARPRGVGRAPSADLCETSPVAYRLHTTSSAWGGAPCGAQGGGPPTDAATGAAA